MLKCPNNCTQEQFCVQVKVVQTWLCNNQGEFIDVAEDVTDVIQHPNAHSGWYCADCGKDAILEV